MTLQRAGTILFFFLGACGRDTAESRPVRTDETAAHRLDVLERIIATPGSDHAILSNAALADDAAFTMESSGVRLRVNLASAHGPLSIRRGESALYRGAWHGNDVLQRVHSVGIETYVALDQRPDVEQLDFDLDVSSVAGIRMVASTIELLDAEGTPRLRMSAPWVDGANGRKSATVALEGCNYDTSTTAPWGRPTTQPGSDHCTLHVSWNGVSYPAIVDPNWTKATVMAFARLGHTMTELPDGKILIAGGCTDTSTFSEACVQVQKTAELFDPKTETFASIGDACFGHAWHTATMMKDQRVLLAGGCSSNSKNPERPCNGPISGASIYKASSQAFECNVGDGGVPATMTVGRAAHAAALLPDGRVLIAGGFISGVLTKTAETFDPTKNTFTALTSQLSTERAVFTATTLGNGKVLLAGGGQTAYYVTFVVTNTADLFDGTSDTFTPTATMTKQRFAHTATLLPDGRVFLAGGTDAFGSVTAVSELYDPTSSTFAATPPTAPIGFESHSAAIHASGKVLIAGGLSGALLFTPGADTFATTGDPPSYLSDVQLVAINTGKVLMTGGRQHNNAPPRVDAALFDLKKNGSACEEPTDCLSGICENSVCCGASCTGACEYCAPGTGSCAPFVNGDLGSCSGESTCDFQGKCRSKIGRSCTTNDTCASGVCRDGVCCNEQCGDQCEVCNRPQALGSCGPVPDTGGLRPPCAGGLVCNGQNTTCVPALCNDHLVQRPDGSQTDCFPYRCDVAGDCGKTCTSAAQCAKGAVCTEKGQCEKAKETSGGSCATGVPTDPATWVGAWLFIAIGRRLRMRKKINAA